MVDSRSDIEHWLWEIGEAAARLAQLGALEGAAGNISLFVPHAASGIDALLGDRFPRAGPWSGASVADLPEGVLIVTGTGRRLRDASLQPDRTLCAIDIQSSGRAWLHRSPLHPIEPTSEIDSHIAIHAVALEGRSAPHAVIHAQPPKITWLSHIPAYREFHRLNRQLLRWQPETIVAFPEGVGILPFGMPGTPGQGWMTAEAMRRHRLIIWSKHGVVARSTHGPLATADLIEYVETAAGYEVTDVIAGRVADGLSLDEIRSVAHRFGASSSLLDDLPEAALGKNEW